MDLNDAGMFVKVNVAAQRARQLMQGAAPKIQTKSRKPAAIAISETFDGHVEAFHVSELPEMPDEEILGGDESAEGEAEGALEDEP